MSNLFWLTEVQMERLRPFFPKSHGVPRFDDRRVLSGIIFINRNGLRWSDAPKCELAVKCNFGLCSLAGSFFSFDQFFTEHLSWRFIPQALARGCVETVANRPQILICECRGIRLAGEVATQPIVGVLYGSFLPRGARITELRITANPVLQILPGTELRPAIKGDRLSGMGRERRQAINQAYHDWFRLPIRVL